MRPQDIKLGKSYNLRNAPTNYYAKAIEILKPKQYPNTHTYTIVKCEWANGKNDTWGLIKYFRPCDMIKERGQQ
jgi:hypothetical protein